MKERQRKPQGFDFEAHSHFCKSSFKSSHPGRGTVILRGESGDPTVDEGGIEGMKGREVAPFICSPAPLCHPARWAHTWST